MAALKYFIPIIVITLTLITCSEKPPKFQPMARVVEMEDGQYRVQVGWIMCATGKLYWDNEIESTEIIKSGLPGISDPMTRLEACALRDQLIETQLNLFTIALKLKKSETIKRVVSCEFKE